MLDVPERGTPAWWDQRYSQGDMPWDHGVVAPEVLEFVQTHRGFGDWALDIGCGTGVHSRELARHGYRVIGLDLSHVALHKALQAARQYDLPWQAVQTNATELALCRQDFAVALDIGCLHTLSDEQRQCYAQGLGRRLRPGGHYLLYAMRARQSEEESGPPGLEPEQIESLFAPDFRVIRRDQGWQGERRADWWFWERR